MPAKKSEVQKVRPYEGDMEIARRIVEETGLELIQVLSLAMSAGLKAIQSNDYRMTLPLALEVVEVVKDTRQPGQELPGRFAPITPAASMNDNPPAAGPSGSAPTPASPEKKTNYRKKPKKGE